MQEVTDLENRNNQTNTDLFEPYIERDLAYVSNWAKKELFKYVRFIQTKGYKKTLSRHGKIYPEFVKECIDNQKLCGIKAASNNTNLIFDKTLYLDRLWTDATEKKTIPKALNHRRSGIYTVMSNRFWGKCTLWNIVCWNNDSQKMCRPMSCVCR